MNITIIILFLVINQCQYFIKLLVYTIASYMVIYNGPVYIPIILKPKHVYPFARSSSEIRGLDVFEAYLGMALNCHQDTFTARETAFRRDPQENFRALTFEKNLLSSGEDGGRPVAEK